MTQEKRKKKVFTQTSIGKLAKSLVRHEEREKTKYMSLSGISIYRKAMASYNLALKHFKELLVSKLY